MRSTVKVFPDSADLSKYLASKMDSSITVKFKGNSPGKDSLCQKDFSHRRDSNVSAQEGFSPVLEHTDHD